MRIRTVRPTFPRRPFLALMAVAACWGPAMAGAQTLPPPGLVPSAPSSSIEYWIISSRRCFQRGQAYCPQGGLGYYSVDAAHQLTPTTQQTFLSSLRFDLPICFVVHGNLTSFEDLRQTAPTIEQWIRGGGPGQPLQIVFYTWPSDDIPTPFPQVALGAGGEQAEFNGRYLAGLVSMFPAHSRVSFFGHSYGARVVASTLHLLGGGVTQINPHPMNAGGPRRYRAVFAAAAIDRDWLNPQSRYGRALWVTEWLLNVRNQADFVINVYPWRTLFGQQALGRMGLSPGDRRQMGWLSARVTEWDVTRKVGSQHAWAFYYTQPDIAAVIAPALFFSDAPRPAFSQATSAW